MPQLKHLSIKAFYDSKNFNRTQFGELTGTVSKREVLTIDKRLYQPTDDFRMPYQAEINAMQNGQLVATKIIPFTSSHTQDIENLIIFVDSSASQAPYLSSTLQRLQTLLPHLKIKRLHLYTFDQTVQNFGIAENPAAQQALIEQVKQYNALGASHFEAAIATLTALKLEKSRLLLISDAVITAGETSAAKLTKQLKTINWLERVDILVPSYHSDKKVAIQLVKAGKSQGIIAPLSLTNTKIIHKLTSSVYTNIPITVSGSKWYWPEKVDALQINEPLIVFAEISEPLKSITVGNKEFRLTSKQVNPILLKREWVRARLDKLLDMEDKTQDIDIKNAFHNEIINLSVKERVLSPYTSLLVLETENDYQRYHIARKGLADILTIGMDGITVIQRAKIPVVFEQPQNPITRPLTETPPQSRSFQQGETLAAARMPEAEMLETDSAAPSRSDERGNELRDTMILAGRRGSVADSVVEMRRMPSLPAQREAAAERIEAKKQKINAWTGSYAEFRTLLNKAEYKAAGKFAQEWRQRDLTNVMALIALGEWSEKTGDFTQAARAYGSLIDYFPARADIRRWAAERLLSIKTASWLSIDSLKKAVKQRPAHPSGHYLLAIAYWEDKQYKAAVETLQIAQERDFPRFVAAKRILTETLAIMLSHLKQEEQLETLFPGKHLKWETVNQHQLRFVLMWETDANDVDFHVYDKQGNHAYYSQKSLPTGGTLYADITTGYGPECFHISTPKAFPYKLQAHYYNMGPMGYGMGVLHLLNYAPKKGLQSEFRPFIVMKNGAFIDLGHVK